jgi:hypothetical protein
MKRNNRDGSELEIIYCSTYAVGKLFGCTASNALALAVADLAFSVLALRFSDRFILDNLGHCRFYDSVDARTLNREH